MNDDVHSRRGALRSAPNIAAPSGGELEDPRESPVLDDMAIYARVDEAMRVQLGRKPVLADMAKTVVANARVLAKALGFDDNPAAIMGAAIAAVAHHTKDANR